VYSEAGVNGSNHVWRKELLKEFSVEQDVPTLGYCSTIEILKNTMLNSGMLFLEGNLVYVSHVVDYPLSKKFQKAYVRRECVNFFHNTISKFLGVEEINILELEVTDNEDCYSKLVPYHSFH
jgi:hypothetical protein